jgi:hypothetical protein
MLPRMPSQSRASYPAAVSRIGASELSTMITSNGRSIRDVNLLVAGAA